MQTIKLTKTINGETSQKEISDFVLTGFKGALIINKAKNILDYYSKKGGLLSKMIGQVEADTAEQAEVLKVLAEVPEFKEALAALIEVQTRLSSTSLPEATRTELAAKQVELENKLNAQAMQKLISSGDVQFSTAQLETNNDEQAKVLELTFSLIEDFYNLKDIDLSYLDFTHPNQADQIIRAIVSENKNYMDVESFQSTQSLKNSKVKTKLQ